MGVIHFCSREYPIGHHFGEGDKLVWMKFMWYDKNTVFYCWHVGMEARVFPFHRKVIGGDTYGLPTCLFLSKISFSQSSLLLQDPDKTY